MEKIELMKYIELGYTQKKIAEAMKLSQSTIKVYLSKFDLKTKRLKIQEIKKICSYCKMEKNVSEFYKRATRTAVSAGCKNCLTKNVLDRQRKFKEACLEYKGNKCIRCLYDKYSGALEFHHRNIHEKEFEMSKYKLFKFDDSVKKELDKCDVLCANCHREVHHEIKLGFVA